MDMQRIKEAGMEKHYIASGLASALCLKDYAACERSWYGGKEAIIFLKETIAEDPYMFMAVRNPDIIVTKHLGDVYEIWFSDKITPDMIGKVDTELKRSFAELAKEPSLRQRIISKIKENIPTIED